MKISYNWLKDYVNINKHPRELARDLTMRSFEVESVRNLSENLENIIVGEIMNIEKHPNADRLKLATVNIGKKPYLRIVCGGVNIEPKQKVPVALVGAKLPGGTRIQQSTIRGIESSGMLCSSEELGLEKSGERRIMILDPRTKIGVDISHVLALDDWIFEINVPANRNDISSHKGVAREIAVILNKKIETTSYNLPKKVKKKFQSQLRIETESIKNCERFAAIVIDNISVQNSPQWLQNRLRNIGIRPINYIVDITNYIMADIGQPLHAFDFNKIFGSKIKKLKIRSAKIGECIVTLDEKERKLSPGTLIIEDGEKILDLAGIMGGQNSAIDDQTRTILLQASIFDSYQIRKTSRTLGLRTQAVAYFEKTIDPKIQVPSLAQAFYHMKEIDNDIALQGAIDMRNKRWKAREIIFHPSSIARVSGIEIQEKNIKQGFKNLGIKIITQKKNAWKLEIPSWRSDLEQEQDIIEEALRLSGYNAITAKLPDANLVDYARTPEINVLPKIKNTLASYGFYEVCNSSFTSKEAINKISDLQAENHLEVMNPLSIDQQYLRSELLSSLLKNIADNFRYQDDVRIFEIGNVFKKDAIRNHQVIDGRGVVASKNTHQKQKLFSEVRDMVISLLTQYCDKDVALCPTPGKKNSVECIIGNLLCASVEEVDESLLRAFDIEGAVITFRLDISLILEYYNPQKIYRETSIYPGVKLDIAFRVQKNIAMKDIIETMLQTGKPMLKEVKLFDVYAHATMKTGEHSVAFHLYYEDSASTLTLEQVQLVHARVTKALQKTYHITVR